MFNEIPDRYFLKSLWLVVFLFNIMFVVATLCVIFLFASIIVDCDFAEKLIALAEKAAFTYIYQHIRETAYQFLSALWST